MVAESLGCEDTQVKQLADFSNFSETPFGAYGPIAGGSRATLPLSDWGKLPTKRPLCETWARMSHPDPNGPPDRRHKSWRGLGESRYRGTLGDPGASLGQPC